MKPATWPRYLIEKRARDGAAAYYWNPPVRDIANGFTLGREKLGRDLATASARADQLNAHLDAWRQGRGAEKGLELQPSVGTLDWLIERYYRSRAFTAKVSARAQRDYRRELALAADIVLKTGARAGTLKLGQISARAADKIYDRLLVGTRKTRRVRQANACLSRLKRAWGAVRRLYPDIVPALNPFADVERESGRTAKAAATRKQAYALADAILKHRPRHRLLAVAPLICFEWLQRPENVLAGHLTWTDWRPPARPTEVEIVHAKTGVRCWHPLEDEQGPLYPELEARLAALPRLGVPIVLQPPAASKPARPYAQRRAARIVREARRLAKLPDHVTLDACRHGGMTELGDADLNEQGIMSLSGHLTPEAARVYVKRTEAQRQRAARKRRAWVEERTKATSQKIGPKGESEKIG